MNRCFALLALLALFAPIQGSGQGTLPMLASGVRVRMHDLEGRENVGILDSFGPDSIALLEEPGDPASREVFDVTSISRVELMVGEHREVLKTVAVVSAVTAASFAVWAAASYRPCNPRDHPVGEIACAAVPGGGSRGGDALLGLVVGAILGIPPGLIIGLLNDHDTWSQVFPAGSGEGVGLNLGLSPGRDGGVRLAGTIGLSVKPSLISKAPASG